MENIRSNEPSTPDSSDQTIKILSDTKIEPQPEPQPITYPKEIDGLVQKFESEANEHLHSMTQERTNCVNPMESDIVWDDFRRWRNSRSWDIKELCYTYAQTRIHDKLYEVIEPLVDMFTPSSLSKALPPQETAFTKLSFMKLKLRLKLLLLL